MRRFNFTYLFAFRCTSLFFTSRILDQLLLSSLVISHFCKFNIFIRDQLGLLDKWNVAPVFSIESILERYQYMLWYEKYFIVCMKVLWGQMPTRSHRIAIIYIYIECSRAFSRSNKIWLHISGAIGQTQN